MFDNPADYRHVMEAPATTVPTTYGPARVHMRGMYTIAFIAMTFAVGAMNQDKAVMFCSLLATLFGVSALQSMERGRTGWAQLSECLSIGFAAGAFFRVCWLYL